MDSKPVKLAEKEKPPSQKVRVRIFVPEAQIGRTISLSKDQIRHLKVLHVTPGEKIGIFDGKGHEYLTTYIPSSEKVSTGLVLEHENTPQQEPTTQITLAIAAPKGNRLDVLIEKVSELGVTTIVPTIFSRSVVLPRETKIERLRKITIEACSQSGRSIVPTISEPVKFTELLKTVKNYNQTIICHKNGTPLTKLYKPTPTILLIVGPEGDFTPQELEAARDAGCIVASLGPTILRVETAGITAVGQVIGNSN